MCSRPSHLIRWDGTLAHCEQEAVHMAWVVSSGARSGPFAGVRLGSSAKSPPQKATQIRSSWCSSSGPMTYLPAHCVLCHLVKTLASSLPLVDLKPGRGTLKGLRTSGGGRVLYQRYLYCVYMYIHPGITHVHVLLGPNYHLTL
jgi:hypothetical protein